MDRPLEAAGRADGKDTVQVIRAIVRRGASKRNILAAASG